MFKKVLEITMNPTGIDTAKLYPILMSSGLPREALGQIWATANRTTPGMLTKEELYTVLALIGVAQVNTGVQTNDPLKMTSLITSHGFPGVWPQTTLKLHTLSWKPGERDSAVNQPRACEALLGENIAEPPSTPWVWQEASYHPQLGPVTSTPGRMQIYRQHTKHCMPPLPCEE